MVDRRPNFVTVISCPRVYSGGSIRWWNNFDQSLSIPFSGFDIILECPGQTNGRMELLYQYRPLH